MRRTRSAIAIGAGLDFFAMASVYLAGTLGIVFATMVSVVAADALFACIINISCRVGGGAFEGAGRIIRKWASHTII